MKLFLFIVIVLAQIYAGAVYSKPILKAVSELQANIKTILNAGE